MARTLLCTWILTSPEIGHAHPKYRRLADGAVCLKAAVSMSTNSLTRCRRAAEHLPGGAQAAAPTRSSCGSGRSTWTSCGQALGRAAGDEASPVGKRVVALVEELRMVLTCLMATNPLGMQSLRQAPVASCVLALPQSSQAHISATTAGDIRARSSPAGRHPVASASWL